MKRIVANFLLVAATAAATPSVYALGLGELTLNSALNQPLKAEIDLLDTGEYSEDQIRAALATYEEFARAGVDRPQFLSGIKFDLDGDRLLLTTREAVNEPFLNFLIELNWPAGRVLREYTLLLDPPTFSESTVQPLVNSPALVEKTTTPAPPVRRPIPEYKNPAAEAWAEPAAPGQYKVRSGDTLWSIASAQAAGTGITPQQMMVAIQQTNPSAFMHGNINQLKAHVVLDIPSAGDVSAINSQVAATEVKRQNTEWTAGTAQLDATDKAAENASSGRSTGNGEVRLLAANGTTDTARSGGLDNAGAGSENALEGDLAIALENLDKSRRENAELTERLNLLQEQLEKMERLVSLQNDELANMQGTSAEVLEAQVDADMAAETAAVEATADAGTATEEVAGEDVVAAEGIDAEAAVDEAVMTGESAVDEVVAETPVAAAQPEAKPATPVATPPATAKPGLQETLMRYKEFVLVGVGLVLALILALFALRRRQMEDDDEDEFIADDYNAADFADGQTFRFEEMSEDDFNRDPDAAAQSESDDFLFAGDDATSEEFDINDAEDDYPDSDEDEKSTDIISQADRYIVFGKFDHAVKLLKEGSEEEPQRTDIRLKLLELLATLDESDEFATAEAGLVALDDEEANARAADLRSQLTVQPQPASSGDAFAIDSELSDDIEESHADEFDGGIDFGDALDMKDAEEPVPQADSDLDFMFGDAPAQEPESAVDESEPTAEAPVFEQFPAAEYPSDEVEEEISAEEPVAEAPETEEQFDLEPEFDTELSVDEEQPVADSSNDPFSIDFPEEEDIVAEDTSEPVKAPGLSLVSNDPEPAPEVAEVEDLEAAPVFEETAAEETSLTEESDLESGIDLDELEMADDEFDFLTGTDECATKLDLARAYVDMEDFEGAKELLEEVVQEGSDQQRQDARDLMDKIA